MREKNKDIQYMKVLIIMLLFLTTMTMSVSAESSPKSVLNKYYTTSLGTKKMFQSYPGSYVYKGGIKGNDLILYGSLDVYDAKTDIKKNTLKSKKRVFKLTKDTKYYSASYIYLRETKKQFQNGLKLLFGGKAGVLGLRLDVVGNTIKKAYICS